MYIPEDWERTERNAQTVASIVRVAGGLLTAVLILAGVITAIISWSRRQFAGLMFLAVFWVCLVLSAIRVANSFPAMMAGLSTSQPLQLQLAILLGTSIVGLTLFAAGLGLIAGASPVWSAATGSLESRTAITIGIALGALAAAARALSALVGSSGPVWPSYAGAGTFVPFLASAVGPVITMLTRVIVLVFAIVAVKWITAGWTRRRAVGALALWLVGGLLGTPGSPENLVLWIASAALVGALLVAMYVGVLRHDVSALPFGVAVMTLTGTLREGWVRPYPGALAGAIVAVVAMSAVAYWWFRALRQKPPTPVALR